MCTNGAKITLKNAMPKVAANSEIDIVVECINEMVQKRGYVTVTEASKKTKASTRYMTKAQIDTVAKGLQEEFGIVLEVTRAGIGSMPTMRYCRKDMTIWGMGSHNSSVS